MRRNYNAALQLRTDLSAGERRQWQEKVQAWHDELADYSAEGGLKTAILAAAERWNDARLEKILRGDDVPSGEEQESWQETLVGIRLRILENRKCHDERLNLARYHGRHGECALALVQLGRADDAEALVFSQMMAFDDFHELAALLHEQGDTDRAMRAEKGLFQKRTTDHWQTRAQRSLARWLRNTAQDVGADQLALRAARVAFLTDLDLADYAAVEQLAGHDWPVIRDALLEEVVQTSSGRNDRRIALFLREGWVAQAVALADEEVFLPDEMVQEVMRAAIANHGDWVIRRSRKEAEEIMDAGKATAYDRAVTWLKLTRDALIATDRPSEWTSLLFPLIQKHHKKYKLRPMLEMLR